MRRRCLARRGGSRLERAGGGARILGSVVTATPDDVRALLIRGTGTIGPPGDFAPRGALELIIHAHDVCTGLGVALDPPREACEHLREHVRDWPFWGGYWETLEMTGDAWDALLRASGRLEPADRST